MNFFAEVKPKRMDLDGSFENSKDPAQADIIDPSIFKRLFHSVAENTFSDKIMRNLSFLLMTKLVTKVIDNAVKESQLKQPNAEHSKTRIRATKQVDTYNSIKFTFEKETDLFFGSTKHQDW